MTDQHPITPPRELVKQWRSEPEYGTPGRATLLTISEQRLLQLLDRSGQWGADTELEACIAWFDKHIPGYELVADKLRAARRPKPPSLKEQALMSLEDGDTKRGASLTAAEVSIIRRALEALPE